MNTNDIFHKSGNTIGEHTQQEIEALENEERIERFLCGEMNADEEAALMEEISVNNTLHQQAMAQAHIIKGMSQADQELIDAMHHAKREHIQHLMKRKEKRGKRQLQMIAATASIILLAIMGWKAYDHHHTKTLAKEYAKEITLPFLTRGDNGGKIQNDLKKLVSLAQNDNDDEAIVQLYNLWQLSKANTYNDYTNFAPYIGWQLAIAYLMKHDKTAARKILQEMKDTYSENTAIWQLAQKFENEF